jgi:methyl-accepting chemotaxis protein
VSKINFKKYQGLKKLKDLNIGNYLKKLLKKPKLNNNNKTNKANKTKLVTNSIKTKIFMSFIALILTVVIVLGGLSLYQNYKVTFDTLEQTMVNLTQVSSSVITNKLEVYKTVSADLGINPILSDLKVNKQEKAKVVKQIVEMYELLDAFTVTAMGSGESPITGELYLINDTDYFLSAMEGNIFISEPAMNKKLDKVTFSVAAPIWKNGEYGTSVNGVAVIVLDGKVLTDVASSVKIGKEGYGFILNKDGVTIGHPEYDKVLSGENIIKNYETDKKYESLAKTEQKLLSGEINFGDYSLNKEKHLITYTPIQGSNGWGFFVSAPESEYLSATYTSIIITLAVSALSLLLAYFVGRNISNNIANPVIACAERLKRLSEGDLHSEVETTNRNDEIGLLIKSLGSTMKGLNVIIDDISYNLGAIAQGDFTASIDMEYKGDFNTIVVSMKKISKYLNEIVRQVNESAEQVASGSDQVAGGAQALSQGATEQASSVEELSATLSEISDQINSNASFANKANESSMESSRQVLLSNNYVKQMNEAMLNISNTSKQIAKIIKVIDDIAFQTNILALNAAVEAARAGVAGRGFAVVADEVRNLASKSAEAARSTTDLIDGSLKAVESGAKISKQTETALELAVEKAEVVANMIQEISNASSQQAEAVSQVLVGIEQISAIVQTNSATAEESAAASEELSGQAQVLKDLVAEIKLKDLNIEESL